jgi:ketosteroid isomerase-like protein
MAHPNEELVRRGFEAFKSRDMGALNDLFADDIVWHAPGRNPLAGDHRGKEAVFATFGKLAEMTGGTFNVEIHDILANDEHVVVLAHATAERNGKRLDDNGVQVFHIRDGKVTEQWLHPGDVYAGDEFFSD